MTIEFHGKRFLARSSNAVLALGRLIVILIICRWRRRCGRRAGFRRRGSRDFDPPAAFGAGEQCAFLIVPESQADVAVAADDLKRHDLTQ
jgi:hypothetical protein